jgi:uncharacterized protein (DUF697 family)/predicted GTPase
MSEQFYEFNEEEFTKASGDAQHDLGRVNIAIFGKTGVGKSTLINTIFGDDLAKTGRGRPVTAESSLYVHESGTLGIFDNRGLEIGDDSDTILKDLRTYVDANRHQSESQHIHVAWYCVNAHSGRFEDPEEEFVRQVAKLHIPVVVVITQVPYRAGSTHKKALDLAKDISDRWLPVVGAAPVLVCAVPDLQRGHEQHGLTDLLDRTFDAAPEGVQAALAAAQRIDLDRKRVQCLAIATAAGAAAGTAAISPVPGSDAAMIVPIQVGMMASIAVLYRIELTVASVAGVVATTLATQLGRLAAGTAVKFIPGIGSVLGATVNATIASGFTVAMGVAWGRVCEKITKGDVRPDDQAGIEKLFKAEFTKRFSKTAEDVEEESPGATDIDAVETAADETEDHDPPAEAAKEV